MRNRHLQKLRFYTSSTLLFLLHLPFVFAKSKPSHESRPMASHIESSLLTEAVSKVTPVKHDNLLSYLYDSLRLNLMGLSHQAFEYAMQGFNYLSETGKIANEKIISIVDFSLPSSRKRLFVIDLEKAKLVFNTYVAHGANSGTATANRFSNTPESNMSSLGFYETQGTYMGSNGYSLKLEGLESGINDNANRRAIVIHGAPYVSESMARMQGYIGRSWGCPALPENLNKPIIDKIKNGSCLFIYSSNKHYLRHSKIIHPAG